MNHPNDSFLIDEVTENLRSDISEVDALAARAASISFSNNAPEPVQLPNLLNDDESSSISERTERDDSADDHNKDIVTARAAFSNRLFDEANDQLVPLSLKPADENFTRIYHQGTPSHQNVDAGKPLRVGLAFLPGATKPEVMRQEQESMNQRNEPNQQTAEWRVKTAGSLLKTHDITESLQLDVKYSNPRLLKAKEAHHTMVEQNYPPGTIINFKQSREYDFVAIDSEYVKIVYNFNDWKGRFDIECTLIEVDYYAMVDLIFRYRHELSKKGTQMENASMLEVLNTMIDDARKLCQRSPALFRASFRSAIRLSKNTRYGINTPQMFRTIITSKGIKEILKWSAAFYNSLSDVKKLSKEQQIIRIKFLQVLVILLSLLNDDDLEDIQNFVESTFRIKADRKNVELLFLKVIPLMSINPNLFLNEILQAFEGFKLNEPDEEDLASYWDDFLMSVTAENYVLPGTVLSLGRNPLSWAPKWPKEGLYSSVIFKDLQYNGILQTINDIPQIDLRPEEGTSELTVMLTTGERLNVLTSDYERIEMLQSGRYELAEPQAAGGYGHELNIYECDVNETTRRAADHINEITKSVNSFINVPNNRGLGNIIGRRRGRGINKLKEYRISAGKLTKHIAKMEQVDLAVAYKSEGHRVTRRDVIGHMNRDNYSIEQICEYYRAILANASLNVPTNYISAMEKRIEKVEALLKISVKVCNDIKKERDLSQDPIVKVLQRDSENSIMPPSWHEYTAKLIPDFALPNNATTLEVTASRSSVASLNWLSIDVVELTIADRSTKFWASPLCKVSEMEQNDQVQVGDIVILMGHYMVIAEAEGGRDNGQLFMVNCLRITSVEEQAPTSMRGQNRLAPPSARGTNRPSGSTNPAIRFL